jgi:prepilin-type processing-associated H-X9-DG protein
MHWNGGVNMSAVLSPAQCICLEESNEGWSEMNLDGCSSWGDVNYNGTNYPALATLHFGTGNFGFCDGHVKALKANVTESETGNNQWDVNGPNTNAFNDGTDTCQQLAGVTAFYAGR